MSDESPNADVAFITALAELLRANDLTELEVTREQGEDKSLTVKLGRQPAPVIAAAAPAPVAPMPAPIAATPTPAPAAPSDATTVDPASDPGAVSSPMVGTVYLQSEPGSPPFVSVGAQVAEGDTLLIVEAMKTMNHIPAPRAGTVKRILVENGAAVEYGAPLIILE